MRHRLSIFLMAASLVLLAVFLFFFLKKTFQDERETLRKETNFLFVNSIRGIEGELLDKFITGEVKLEKDTARTLIFKTHTHGKTTDSTMIFNFVTDRQLHVHNDSINLQLRMKDGQPSKSEMFGSLSVIVALDDSSGVRDSNFARKAGLDILPVIKENFDKAILGSGLPIQHRVIRLDSLHNDSLRSSKVLMGGSYTDLATGERFGAELSGFNGYLLKQMLPELLFSLGLFACVALAFFSVFKNLQAQRRLTELKNDFIRNVTHELKTPIATVGVAIEALQDFDGLKNPERTKEYLDISRLELNRLSLLVDKVLRMSLFEKAEPELVSAPLDFQELIQEIMASMKLQFDKCQANVSLTFEGQGFTMNGDRLHLASVVYNLFDNALKYSPGKPQINVALSGYSDHLALSIKDAGRGIPDVYKDKIFDKFFRVPTGDVHDVKGHGLGLSYVASVVAKHGGTIGMESRVGEGTVFSIQLPRKN